MLENQSSYFLLTLKIFIGVISEINSKQELGQPCGVITLLLRQSDAELQQKLLVPCASTHTHTQLVLKQSPPYTGAT